MVAVHALNNHPPVLSPVVAFYAQFHREAGYALRLPDRRVFFVDHEAHSLPLTNADIPALILCGAVNLCEQQHLLDTLAGGAAAIACGRGGVA